ncbi:MAG: DUF2442 domain-containing protein [Bacteroidetes bacterium]|nr:DUF2442 domain-containing protein [Bacteroidota bacterium]
MIATHNIQNITFDKGFMCLKIDNKSIKIALDKISSKLKNADDLQRSFYKISPSGYGIHWSLIDEDLSVEAILKQYVPQD